MFNKFNLFLKQFTDKGTSRPEMAGIYFGKEESASTDGFTLIRINYPNSDSKEYPTIDSRKVLDKFKPFILPSKEAEKVLKLLPEKAELPILENAVLLKQKKSDVEIGTTDLSSFNVIRSRVIEGQFPDYKQLLTKKGKHIKISVNVKFLKRIVDFLYGFIDGGINEIKLEIPVDNTQPIRFYGKREGTGQKCEVLLMMLKSETE